MLCIFPSVFIRNNTADCNQSAGGNQHAGKHLDGGGFTGAVRADISHQFPFFKGKGDISDSLFYFVFPVEQRFHRAGNSLAGDGDLVFLAQVFYFNKAHVGPRFFIVLHFYANEINHDPVLL